jgi:predicted enzyme related to lactoylglutathione lyase
VGLRAESGERAGSGRRQLLSANAPDLVYGRSLATRTIEVPDIRKAFEELKAKGVQFETEVLEYPWGWVAVFLDLDGNRLQVRHGR